MSTFRTGINGSPGVSTDWRGLTVAKITAVNYPTSGPLDGRAVYSWLEQSFDPATGASEDSPTPRKGTYTSATVFSNILLDVNDAKFAVDSYVWIRLKGQVYGTTVYESAGGGAPAVYHVKLTGSGAGIDGGTAWAGRIQDEDNGAVTDNGYIGATPNTPTYVMYRTLAEDGSLGSPAIGDIVIAVPDKDTPGVWLFRPKVTDGFECGGCGWLEDLPEETCFKFRMDGGEGRCGCIPSEGYTTSGSGMWVEALQGWLSTQMKSTCCGCGGAILEIDAADCRETTVTLKNFHIKCDPGSGSDLFTLVMKFDCSGINTETGNRYARFVGKGPSACDGEVLPCGNSFYLTVECFECPDYVCDCCCTQYSPPSWYEDIPAASFDDDTLNGFWVWSHVEGEGCKWLATCEEGGDKTSTLEYLPASAKFRLTHGTFVYEKTLASWTCAGENALTYVSGAGTHPASITVRPIGSIADPETPSPCALPDTLTVTITAAACPVMNGSWTVTRPVPENDLWTFTNPGTGDRMTAVNVECVDGVWGVNATAQCKVGAEPEQTYEFDTSPDQPDSAEFNPLEMIWTGVEIAGDPDYDVPCCTETTATVTVTE